MKQYLREKVSDVEDKTDEGKDFHELVKQFYSNRDELGLLVAKAQEWGELNIRLHSQMGAFGASIAHLGSHRKAEPKAAAVVQAFVPYSLQLQSIQQRFNESFSELLLQPLQELINTEVKKTGQLLKDLEICRLDFDARRATMASAHIQKKAEDDPERQLAKTKSDESKALYEQTKQQIQDLCHLVETRKNTLLQVQLAEFVRAHYYYHSKSAETISSRVKDVIDLSAPPRSPRKGKDKKDGAGSSRSIGSEIPKAAAAAAAPEAGAPDASPRKKGPEGGAASEPAPESSSSQHPERERSESDASHGARDDREGEEEEAER